MTRRRPKAGARTPKPSSGFTLLEITITLAILGIVLTIVYGVFSQTLAAKELAERRTEEAAGARAALTRITQDLQTVRVTYSGHPGASQAAAPGVTPTPTPSAGGEGAYRPQHGVFIGRTRSEGGVALDDLAFTSFVRRPAAMTFAGTDLGIVHYFVDAVAPNSNVLGLYRETIFSLTGDAFDPDKPNPANSVLILPNVSSVAFRFFDGNDWVNGWDSTDSRNFAPAPQAVEVTLAQRNDRGESETYETAIDLPMVRNVRNPQLAGRPTPRR